MEYQHIEHPIPPIWNQESEILILGSFPSVKSRESAFFYGHKQNRFWKVIAHLCQTEVPETVEEKRKLLLENHIAVWDVIQSCDIIGSSDSSIKNVVPANLNEILENASIKQIFANGSTAGRLYQKHQRKQTGREIVILPSTSPANAAWSLERLEKSWEQILIEMGKKIVGGNGHMKVYGTPICIDCRNYKAIQEKRGFDAAFIDITENTANLKEFLQIRDTDPVFTAIKEQQGIGIPLFVREDGTKTFDIDEAMGWIGQPPIKESEIVEHRAPSEES